MANHEETVYECEVAAWSERGSMHSRDIPQVDFLETERLLLPMWREEDLERLARVHTDPAVSEALRRPAGSVEQVKRTFDYIVGHWDRFGFGPWATFEKTSGRFVGNVGLEYMADWLFEDKVEIGYVLGSEFWGRGYATEAARASMRHGFAVIELGRIISTTYADHWVSRRVMEKCGMTFQGIVRWRDADIAWYAADRRSAPGDPADPEGHA
jgi:ribosomal-protein-alanine N-acetyltransferase